jgi:drug/metabolite transporter (DMT)-like permease
MNGSAASSGLGFISAVSWGGSDFLGGLGSRRSPALLIVMSGQVLALFLLTALCLGLHLRLPGTCSALCAIVGGLIGSIALALFYHTLAMGPMGSSAAVTGLLTAVVPVVFSLIHSGLPSAVNGAGLAAGLAAIWLITNAPAAGGGGPGEPAATAASWGPSLALAALAGVGFGTQLILIKMAGEGGIWWTMTLTRGAGVVALSLILALRPPRRPWGRYWRTGLPAGLLDTAGIAVYIVASQIGRLDAVAVTCSLYPAVTILLAAALLHERPTRRQTGGMALAVVAVALLSL